MTPATLGLVPAVAANRPVPRRRHQERGSLAFVESVAVWCARCWGHGSRFARVLFASLAAIAGAHAHAQDGSSLPDPATVRPQLYATGFEFAEGPTFDDQGNLFVVNYRRLGTIGRITPDGTASIWCALETLAPAEGRAPQANGLKVDGEGRLIVADAGGGRLLRISSDGKQAEVLADRFEGERFRAINDVALDLQGNIYFSDPGNSSADNPIGAVYRYDIRTKKTSLLAAKLAFPNGLAVTPDEQRLCVAESHRFRVLAIPLRDAGASGPPQTLIDFPREDAQGLRGGSYYPDGLVFDAHGRLYVAMWTGGIINVVDVATGKILRQYDAGGDKVTNCHFHGTDLYTTVAAKEAVFRIPLGVKGHRYR